MHNTDRGAAQPGFSAWVVAPIVVLGFLLRLAAAQHLPPHLDEGNMLLGIHAVAEHGWPLLPSGVAYLHGATVSYLLAPLAWFGWVDYGDLVPLRLFSAACGALAVYLAYRLTRDVVGSGAAGALAAGLVALDPLSVVWGGFVRMYAPLQALALVVAWLFVRLLAADADALPPAARRRLAIGLVVAFWLAVFTQILAALFWPAMALAAALFCGRSLLGSRRGLAGTLGLCLGAPLAFLAASTLLGHGSGTARSNQADWLPAVSFLGNDRLDPNVVHAPDPAVWTTLFPGNALAQFVPALLLGAFALLVGRFLLAAPGAVAERRTRLAVGALLLLYWTPVLVLSSAAVRTRERYLLEVQALGYVLVAVAAAVLWTRRPGALPRQTWAARATATAAVVVLLVHFADGLWTVGAWATDETDSGLAPALAYVAARRAPGNWVVVDSPPEAALLLGRDDGVRVIGRVRALRDANGTPVDDRVGWPILDETRDLCEVLGAHPGTWIVQGHRLEIPAPMVDVIARAGVEEFRTPDGFLVLRSRSPAVWDWDAIRRCRHAGAGALRPFMPG